MSLLDWSPKKVDFFLGTSMPGSTKYIQGGEFIVVSHTHTEILESVEEMNINEFPDNL